jgi:hypothetical protein
MPVPFIKIALLAAAGLVAALVFAVVKSVRTGRVRPLALFALPVLAFPAAAAFIYVLRAEDNRSAEVMVAAEAAQKAVEADLRAFQRADVLVLPDRSDTPSRDWVKNAGGSQPTEVRSGGLKMSVRLPGPDGKLVGYSGPEATEEEALRKARASLKEQLRGLALAEMTKRSRGRVSGDTARELERVADGALGTTIPELERFHERVQLPKSGMVAYRAAILIKVEKNWAKDAVAKASQSAKSLAEESRAVQRDRLWTLLSALGLAFSVYLVYSFLNAGSKGHLAWPLRIISVTAYALLCAALLYLKGLFT